MQHGNAGNSMRWRRKNHRSFAFICGGSENIRIRSRGGKTEGIVGSAAQGWTGHGIGHQ
jgi:hypothetical protein